MTVTLQPVRVAAGEQGDGQLVFADGELVALLVRLSEAHEGLAGHWFLEFGLGRLGRGQHPSFADLHAAQSWIEARLN